MSKKLATLIKEARTEAGLTQQELAKKVTGLTANDISKIEHNEKEPTTEQIKQIAKATGVTQKSLLEAASKKGSSSSSSSSSSTSSMKLTAAEKKLVELYRDATSDQKKAAVKILKGEMSESSQLISTLLGNAMENMLKK